MTYTPFFSKTSFDENITNQKNPYTDKERAKKIRYTKITEYYLEIQLLSTEIFT